VPEPEAPSTKAPSAIKLPLLLASGSTVALIMLGLLLLVLLRAGRPRGRSAPPAAPMRALVASPPQHRPAAQLPGGAWGALSVIGGQAAAARYVLAGTETLIGREDSCPVQLVGDATISRRHAIVRNDGRQIMVIDAGSTHGTYLNGYRIAGPVSVRRGMVLQVGQTLLRFE
jgi:hypothetical protein